MGRGLAFDSVDEPVVPCLTRVSAAKATFISSKNDTVRLAMHSNVLIIRSPATLNAYTV
jgi:hypothetical protein